MDVPLFPLHTVLCPGIALPLHVFEPRYRLMVGRCLAAGSPFGVVWIRDGREVGSGDLAIAAVGTFAEIRDADTLADGRYDLVAVGTGRFRVAEVFVGREPYLVARVEPVEDQLGDEPRTRRLSRLVTRRFVRYVQRVRELAEEDEAAEGPREGTATPGSGTGAMKASGPEARQAPEGAARGADATQEGATESFAAADVAIPADPTLLSYLLAGIVELDLPHRQALLEADTTEERLVDLANVLAREVAYLEQRLRVFTPDAAELPVRRN